MDPQSSHAQGSLPPTAVMGLISSLHDDLQGTRLQAKPIGKFCTIVTLCDQLLAPVKELLPIAILYARFHAVTNEDNMPANLVPWAKRLGRLLLEIEKFMSEAHPLSQMLTGISVQPYVENLPPSIYAAVRRYQSYLNNSYVTISAMMPKITR